MPEKPEKPTLRPVSSETPEIRRREFSPPSAQELTEATPEHPAYSILAAMLERLPSYAMQEREAAHLRRLAREKAL